MAGTENSSAVGGGAVWMVRAVVAIKIKIFFPVLCLMVETYVHILALHLRFSKICRGSHDVLRSGGDGWLRPTGTLL